MRFLKIGARLIIVAKTGQAYPERAAGANGSGPALRDFSNKIFVHFNFMNAYFRQQA